MVIDTNPGNSGVNGTRVMGRLQYSLRLKLKFFLAVTLALGMVTVVSSISTMVTCFSFVPWLAGFDQVLRPPAVTTEPPKKKARRERLGVAN